MSYTDKRFDQFFSRIKNIQSTTDNDIFDEFIENEDQMSQNTRDYVVSLFETHRIGVFKMIIDKLNGL